MGLRDNDALNNLSQYFSKDPDVFSIFEEEIDIEVQKKFYDFLDILMKEYETKDNDSLKDIDKLFDDNVSVNEKKKILVLLSNLYEVSAYRAIENFIENGDKNLNKWAVLAHQQSRMMLESSLMDKKSIFISTGLGGKDNKLRYFCVLFTQKISPLNDDEKDIVMKELTFGFNSNDSILETIEYTVGIITLKALIPINANIKEMFDNIIQEINCQGYILKDNMIITNVKALSIEEIDTLLQQKSED